MRKKVVSRDGRRARSGTWKLVHHRVDAFLQPQCERIGERGLQLANRLRLALAEVAEDEIRQRAAALVLRADADPQARVVLRFERAFDALQAVVAAGAALRAKAKA